MAGGDQGTGVDSWALTVVWKLDRLGRDLRHLVNTVQDLAEHGIGFKVITGQGANIDTTTALGKLAFGIQACLRPRDRFWDIPVPKIDSAFGNLLVPQPFWSPSTTQQLRKLVAAPYLSPNDWTPRSDAYFASPLALCARRVSSAASRLLGTTSLRFALHGWQRGYWSVRQERPSHQRSTPQRSNTRRRRVSALPTPSRRCTAIMSCARFCQWAR